MRNDTDLGPSAVANFVRGELARSLRSKKPYTVNLLLGGMDPITKKPSLYWLDYLAALAPLPYAAHGYAQYVFTNHYFPGYVSSRMGFRLGAVADSFPQILLPFDSRQTPSPRHRLRARSKDTTYVHRRAEATVTNRLQGGK